MPLNNIRKRTAEHMVMSKSTSPHVLTAMEVDYERVEQVRKMHKGAWKAEEGFSLTYLPFIARAVADARRDFPHLNASFGGDHLVVHDEVNMAIAVDIDFEGLLAPVVKNVDGKRLRQIARDITDVAGRTRTKQRTPDDLSGGTFTLTNAGQYGTMMQFPIINQPQVAILSTDGVKRKPVVVTDELGTNRSPSTLLRARPGVGPPRLRRGLRRSVPQPDSRNPRGAIGKPRSADRSGLVPRAMSDIERLSNRLAAASWRHGPVRSRVRRSGSRWLGRVDYRRRRPAAPVA